MKNFKPISFKTILLEIVVLHLPRQILVHQERRFRNTYYHSTNPFTGKLRYSTMTLTAKIDVLDLLIETLRQYEKELDGLIDRLEKAIATTERLSIR